MIRKWLPLIVLALALPFAILYLGLYDVSALKPHSPLVTWALTTGMRRSVHRHAPEIESPPLSDPALVEAGFHHYREMCVVCHGAPGVEPSEVGKGLNPPPPDLAKAARRWSPSELSWIMKNGIRMTGMPAFGETHDQRDLWAMVAFVRTLPRLTPEAYREMERKARAGAQGHHGARPPAGEATGEEGEEAPTHDHSRHEHGH